MNMLYLPSIFEDDFTNDMMNGLSVFDNFDRDFDRRLYGRHAKNLMKTDIRELDDNYEIDIDLPGFNKDNILLKLEGGYLTISANKDVENDKKKHGKVIKLERYSGNLQRSFYVGEAVKQEDIKASFTDGVLKISVPKQNLPDTSSGYIQIEG